MLSAETVGRIRELRYEDGLTADRTAAAVGVSVGSVQRYAPGRPGKVDNAKLREAFVVSGRSAQDVARGMDWRAGASADGSRVSRALGLLPDLSCLGRRSVRRMVDAETAALLAEAVGVQPWEVMPDEDVA